MGEQLITFLVMALGALILLFLICREIVCWYFKINETLGLLRGIHDLLAATKTTQTQQVEQEVEGIGLYAAHHVTATTQTQQVGQQVEGNGGLAENPPSMGICESCGAKIPLNAKECKNCPAQYGPHTEWRIQPLPSARK